MKLWLRILIGVSIALAVATVAAGALALYFLWPSDFRSDWQQPAEQHLTGHLDDLKRDRDALLQSFRKSKTLLPIVPEHLPESLRVPGLKYALVHQDHLTLILYHSPDTDSGFRIWRSTMPADFADRATPIPFVTRFTYCDDYPESPSNKLE